MSNKVYEVVVPQYRNMIADHIAVICDNDYKIEIKPNVMQYFIKIPSDYVYKYSGHTSLKDKVFNIEAVFYNKNRDKCKRIQIVPAIQHKVLI